MCTAATQYCIVGKKTRSTGGVSTDGQCVAKPAGCNDCDCATANAPTAFTRVGAGCKDATVVCESSNGTITVQCQK